MRRCLSAFLILLLVLRGLVGSAMAAGLVPMLAPAGPSTSTTVSAAQAPGTPHAAAHGPQARYNPHAHHGAAAAPAVDHASATHPCGLHTAASADGACPAPADGASGPCAACEICHSAMLTPPALALALAPAPQTGPARLAARYANAPRAPAIKPPIA